MSNLDFIIGEQYTKNSVLPFYVTFSYIFLPSLKYNIFHSKKLHIDIVQNYPRHGICLKI
jgi:hypothetical protein